jgi:hypothetical protein
MNRPRFDFYRDFVFSVHGMNVRHPVLAVKHADYDPEEAREFRHIRSCSSS